MFKNSVILILMNAHFDDGCDYALQTTQILAKDNPVFVLLLSDLLTWKTIIKSILRPKTCRIFFKHWNAYFIHPFFIIPGQRFTIIKELNFYLNALFIKLLVFFFYKRKNKILWFFEPYNTPPFLAVFSNYYSLYDCVDYFTEVSESNKNNEAYILKRIDHMVVNSSVLLHCYQSQRSSIHVVPLGFASDLFSKPSRNQFAKKLLPKKPKQVIGYIGGLNFRLDYDLLYNLIDQLPDSEFRFIGPKQTDFTDFIQEGIDVKIPKLLSLKNVVWHDNQPKSTIPSLIDQFDITWIPYDINIPFNKYCYPMKLLEYFYLGKPVLATPIETLKTFNDLILLGETAEDFKRNIDNLKTQGWSKEKQLLQRNFAITNSWERKLRAISTFIKKDLTTFRPVH